MAIEYKSCIKCGFWVTTETKRCPNCGKFYPTKTKSKIKTYAYKGAVIGVGIGVLLFLLIIIISGDSNTTNDLGSAFGGMLVATAIIGLILGGIIGLIYEGYSTISNFKIYNQSYLTKDENKIRQREDELNKKEQQVTESLQRLEESIQLVKHPTEKFELARKTLENALIAITQQQNQYKVKLLEIAYIPHPF